MQNEQREAQFQELDRALGRMLSMDLIDKTCGQGSLRRLYTTNRFTEPLIGLFLGIHSDGIVRLTITDEKGGRAYEHVDFHGGIPTYREVIEAAWRRLEMANGKPRAHAPPPPRRRS